MLLQQVFSRGLAHTARRAIAAASSTQVAITAVREAHQKPKMKANVRMPDAEDAITVTLTIDGRMRTLNRPRDEPLQKALSRLKANLAPQKSKGKRRQQDGTQDGAAAQDIVVALYLDKDCKSAIPETTSNADAWAAAQALAIGPAVYEVECNAPHVEKVFVPTRPMAGFPQLPRCQLLFADPALTQWSWQRCKPGSSEWEPVQCSSNGLYTPTAADVGYILRAQCTPAAMRPGGAGGLWHGVVGEAVTGPVEPAPAVHAALTRCAHITQAAQTPTFRILSYNLLADQYAGSTYAQTVLFSYCPKECLDPEYRRQLILAELAGYQADILCLQEVDEKLFRDFLVPHLELLGYAGVYTNKQGKVREGSATFWRTSRFRRLMTRELRMRELYKEPLKPVHAHWKAMLDASPHLVDALQHVTTIAQATVLMPVEPSAGGTPLCVVNTHLFFHPYAPHIRTMHTAAILEEASELLTSLQRYSEQAEGVQGPGHSEDGEEQQLRQAASALAGVTPTLLFCGDLNSDLNDGVPGVVELLQTGKLSSRHWDWRMGANFRWGMGEEDGDAEQQAGAPQPPGSAIAAAVAAAKAASEQQQTTAQRQAGQTDHGPSVAALDDGHAFDQGSVPGERSVEVVGIDIQAPFQLRSSDDLQTPFTNYTSGYKALLDYVWIEEHRLKVTNHVPVPSEGQLAGFLPSPSFPSDHLAVVYDLQPVPTGPSAS